MEDDLLFTNNLNSFVSNSKNINKFRKISSIKSQIQNEETYKKQKTKKFYKKSTIVIDSRNRSKKNLLTRSQMKFGYSNNKFISNNKYYTNTHNMLPNHPFISQQNSSILIVYAPNHQIKHINGVEITFESLSNNFDYSKIGIYKNLLEFNESTSKPVFTISEIIWQTKNSEKFSDYFKIDLSKNYPDFIHNNVQPGNFGGNKIICHKIIGSNTNKGFPESNHYKINLGRSYSNVVQIKLINIELPNTSYTINSIKKKSNFGRFNEAETNTNNTIKWINYDESVETYNMNSYSDKVISNSINYDKFLDIDVNLKSLKREKKYNDLNTNYAKNELNNIKKNKIKLNEYSKISKLDKNNHNKDYYSPRLLHSSQDCSQDMQENLLNNVIQTQNLNYVGNSKLWLNNSYHSINKTFLYNLDNYFKNFNYLKKMELLNNLKLKNYNLYNYYTKLLAKNKDIFTIELEIEKQILKVKYFSNLEKIRNMLNKNYFDLLLNNDLLELKINSNYYLEEVLIDYDKFINIKNYIKKSKFIKNYKNASIDDIIISIDNYYVYNIHFNPVDTIYFYKSEFKSVIILKKIHLNSNIKLIQNNLEYTGILKNISLNNNQNSKFLIGMDKDYYVTIQNNNNLFFNKLKVNIIDNSLIKNMKNLGIGGFNNIDFPKYMGHHIFVQNPKPGLNIKSSSLEFIELKEDNFINIFPITINNSEKFINSIQLPNNNMLKLRKQYTINKLLKKKQITNNIKDINNKLKNLIKNDNINNSNIYKLYKQTIYPVHIKNLIDGKYSKKSFLFMMQKILNIIPKKIYNYKIKSFENENLFLGNKSLFKLNIIDSLNKIEIKNYRFLYEYDKTVKNNIIYYNKGIPYIFIKIPGIQIKTGDIIRLDNFSKCDNIDSNVLNKDHICIKKPSFKMSFRMLSPLPDNLYFDPKKYFKNIEKDIQLENKINENKYKKDLKKYFIPDDNLSDNYTDFINLKSNNTGNVNNTYGNNNISQNENYPLQYNIGKIRDRIDIFKNVIITRNYGDLQYENIPFAFGIYKKKRDYFNITKTNELNALTNRFFNIKSKKNNNDIINYSNDDTTFKTSMNFSGSKLLNGVNNDKIIPNYFNRFNKNSVNTNGIQLSLILNEIIVKIDDINSVNNDIIIGRIKYFSNNKNSNNNGNYELSFDLISDIRLGNFNFGDILIGLDSKSIFSIVPYSWNYDGLPTNEIINRGFGTYISEKYRNSSEIKNLINSNKINKFQNLFNYWNLEQVYNENDGFYIKINQIPNNSRNNGFATIKAKIYKPLKFKFIQDSFFPKKRLNIVDNGFNYIQSNFTDFNKINIIESYISGLNSLSKNNYLILKLASKKKYIINSKIYIKHHTINSNLFDMQKKKVLIIKSVEPFRNYLKDLQINYYKFHLKQTIKTIDNNLISIDIPFGNIDIIYNYQKNNIQYALGNSNNGFTTSYSLNTDTDSKFKIFTDFGNSKYNNFSNWNINNNDGNYLLLWQQDILDKNKFRKAKWEKGGGDTNNLNSDDLNIFLELFNIFNNNLPLVVKYDNVNNIFLDPFDDKYNYSDKQILKNVYITEPNTNIDNRLFQLDMNDEQFGNYIYIGQILEENHSNQQQFDNLYTIQNGHQFTVKHINYNLSDQNRFIYAYNPYYSIDLFSNQFHNFYNINNHEYNNYKYLGINSNLISSENDSVTDFILDKDLYWNTSDDYSEELSLGFDFNTNINIKGIITQRLITENLNYSITYYIKISNNLFNATNWNNLDIYTGPIHCNYLNSDFRHIYLTDIRCKSIRIYFTNTFTETFENDIKIKKINIPYIIKVDFITDYNEFYKYYKKPLENLNPTLQYNYIDLPEIYRSYSSIKCGYNKSLLFNSNIDTTLELSVIKKMWIYGWGDLEPWLQFDLGHCMKIKGLIVKTIFEGFDFCGTTFSSGTSNENVDENENIDENEDEVVSEDENEDENVDETVDEVVNEDENIDEVVNEDENVDEVVNEDTPDYIYMSDPNDIIDYKFKIKISNKELSPEEWIDKSYLNINNILEKIDNQENSFILFNNIKCKYVRLYPQLDDSFYDIHYIDRIKIYSKYSSVNNNPKLKIKHVELFNYTNNNLLVLDIVDNIFTKTELPGNDTYNLLNNENTFVHASGIDEDTFIEIRLNNPILVNKVSIHNDNNIFYTSNNNDRDTLPTKIELKLGNKVVNTKTFQRSSWVKSIKTIIFNREVIKDGLKAAIILPSNSNNEKENSELDIIENSYNSILNYEIFTSKFYSLINNNQNYIKIDNTTFRQELGINNNKIKNKVFNSDNELYINDSLTSSKIINNYQFKIRIPSSSNRSIFYIKMHCKIFSNNNNDIWWWLSNNRYEYSAEDPISISSLHRSRFTNNLDSWGWREINSYEIHDRNDNIDINGNYDSNQSAEYNAHEFIFNANNNNQTYYLNVTIATNKFEWDKIEIINIGARANLLEEQAYFMKITDTSNNDNYFTNKEDEPFVIKLNLLAVQNYNVLDIGQNFNLQHEIINKTNITNNLNILGFRERMIEWFLQNPYIWNSNNLEKVLDFKRKYFQTNIGEDYGIVEIDLALPIQFSTNDRLSQYKYSKLRLNYIFTINQNYMCPMAEWCDRHVTTLTPETINLNRDYEIYKKYKIYAISLCGNGYGAEFYLESSNTLKIINIGYNYSVGDKLKLYFCKNNSSKEFYIINILTKNFFQKEIISSAKVKYNYNKDNNNSDKIYIKMSKIKSSNINSFIRLTDLYLENSNITQLPPPIRIFRSDFQNIIVKLTVSPLDSYGNRSGFYNCYKLYFDRLTLENYIENSSSKVIKAGTFIKVNSSTSNQSDAYGIIRYNIDLDSIPNNLKVDDLELTYISVELKSNQKFSLGNNILIYNSYDNLNPLYLNGGIGGEYKIDATNTLKINLIEYDFNQYPHSINQNTNISNFYKEGNPNDNNVLRNSSNVFPFLKGMGVYINHRRDYNTIKFQQEKLPKSNKLNEIDTINNFKDFDSDLKPKLLGYVLNTTLESVDDYIENYFVEDYNSDYKKKNNMMILNIFVLKRGDNYSINDLVTIIPNKNDQKGQGAKAIISQVYDNGGIKAIKIISGGKNYSKTYPPHILITRVNDLNTKSSNAYAIVNMTKYIPKYDIYLLINKDSDLLWDWEQWYFPLFRKWVTNNNIYPNSETNNQKFKALIKITETPFENNFLNFDKLVGIRDDQEVTNIPKRFKFSIESLEFYNNSNLQLKINSFYLNINDSEPILKQPNELIIDKEYVIILDNIFRVFLFYDNLNSNDIYYFKYDSGSDIINNNDNFNNNNNNNNIIKNKELSELSIFRKESNTFIKQQKLETSELEQLKQTLSSSIFNDNGFPIYIMHDTFPIYIVGYKKNFKSNYIEFQHKLDMPTCLLNGDKFYLCGTKYNNLNYSKNKNIFTVKDINYNEKRIYIYGRAKCSNGKNEFNINQPKKFSENFISEIIFRSDLPLFGFSKGLGNNNSIGQCGLYNLDKLVKGKNMFFNSNRFENLKKKYQDIDTTVNGISNLSFKDQNDYKNYRNIKVPILDKDADSNNINLSEQISKYYDSKIYGNYNYNNRTAVCTLEKGSLIVNDNSIITNYIDITNTFININENVYESDTIFLKFKHNFKINDKIQIIKLDDSNDIEQLINLNYYFIKDIINEFCIKLTNNPCNSDVSIKLSIPISQINIQNYKISLVYYNNFYKEEQNNNYFIVSGHYDYFYNNFLQNKCILNYNQPFTTNEKNFFNNYNIYLERPCLKLNDSNQINNYNFINNNYINNSDRIKTFNRNCISIHPFDIGKSVYIYNHINLVDQYNKLNLKNIDNFNNLNNNKKITGINNGTYNVISNLLDDINNGYNLHYQPGTKVLINLDFNEQIERGFRNKGKIIVKGLNLDICGNNSQIYNENIKNYQNIALLDINVKKNNNDFFNNIAAKRGDLVIKVCQQISNNNIKNIFEIGDIIFIGTYIKIKNNKIYTTNSNYNLNKSTICELNVIKNIYTDNNQTYLKLVSPLLNNHFKGEIVISKYKYTYSKTIPEKINDLWSIKIYKNPIIYNKNDEIIKNTIDIKIGDILCFDWAVKRNVINNNITPYKINSNKYNIINISSISNYNDKLIFTIKNNHIQLNLKKNMEIIYFVNKFNINTKLKECYSYFINEIINDNQFTISENIGGKNIKLDNISYINNNDNIVFYHKNNYKELYTQQYNRISNCIDNNTYYEIILEKKPLIYYPKNTSILIIKDKYENQSLKSNNLATQLFTLNNEYYTKIFYRSYNNNNININYNKDNYVNNFNIIGKGIPSFNKFTSKKITINGNSGCKIPFMPIPTINNDQNINLVNESLKFQIKNSHNILNLNYEIESIEPISDKEYIIQPVFKSDFENILNIDYFDLDIKGNFLPNFNKFNTDINKYLNYNIKFNWINNNKFKKFNYIIIKGKYLGFGGNIIEAYDSNDSIINNSLGHNVVDSYDNYLVVNIDKNNLNLKNKNIKKNNNILNNTSNNSNRLSYNFINNETIYNNIDTDIFKDNISIGKGGVIFNKKLNAPVQLIENNYIYLCIPEFNNINTTSDNTIFTSAIFAKILLPGESNEVIYNSHIGGNVEYNEKLININKAIEIAFITPDGNLFDFNGLDHSFTIEIYELIDTIES